MGPAAINLLRGLLLLLCISGCGPEPPPAVGYSGPLPSAAAQAAVEALAGKAFTDSTGVFGIGVWNVVGGIVGGYGYVVVLRQGKQEVHLPVLSDGDAADFHRRITGMAHPTLSGPTTPKYAEKWAPRR